MRARAARVRGVVARVWDWETARRRVEDIMLWVCTPLW